MKYKLGATLFVLSILMAGSPAAQDAKGLLQAADKAIGASAVNSVQYNATGWIRFLGQNFTADQDWNRVDLQSYTATIDYGASRRKKSTYEFRATIRASAAEPGSPSSAPHGRRTSSTATSRGH
jgi:hypothetical protein